MRRGLAVIVLAVLLGTVALVGCLGGSDDPDEAVQAASEPTTGASVEATDPPDDGYLVGKEYARGAGNSACWATGPAGGACYTAVHTAVEPVPDGIGQEAPPELEITGLQLLETATEIHVSLELDRLDPSYGAAIDEEDVFFYLVCWAEPRQCVYASPVETADGPAMDYVQYEAYTEDCNIWWWCSSGVPIEVAFGEPATLTWKVPRSLLPEDAAGTVLEGISGGVERLTSQHDGYAYYDVDDPMDPEQPVAYGFLAPGNRYLVDDASADPLTLQLDAPDGAGLQAWQAVDDPAGEEWGTVWPQPTADADVRMIEMDESPDELVLAFQLEQVPAEPTDQGFWLALGFASGPVYQLGYSASDGDHGEWAGVSVDDEEDWRHVPVGFEAQPGEPGWVKFTLDRADLEPIEAGEQTALFWGTAWAKDPGRQETSAGPLAVGQGTYGPVDFVLPPSYVFEHGSEPASPEGGPSAVFVGDGEGDVRAAEVPGTMDPSTLDITSVRVERVSDGLSRLVLGVAALGDGEVPAGYDATVHAVAIDTSGGPFMAFYHVPRGAQPAFYCAPDTLVFADQASDPMSVPGQQIDGVISRGSTQPGGSDGPAEPTITFLVPHTCTGTAGPGPIEVTAIGGATALLQENPLGGEVRTMDDVIGSESIVLSATTVPTDSAWWSNAELWLIGLGALLVGAEGWILLGRRRRLSEARAEEREIAYAKMVEDGVEGGASSDDLRQRLKPMRAALGISEKQHARVEAEVRSRLAGLTGGPRGLVPGELFLDRYEVVRFLAAGGAGRTYLCRDTRLSREVVLKVLRAPDEEADMDPVLNEAQAFATVQDHRTVTLHDIEAVGDDVYLVLEHVEGGSLKDRIAQGPLGPGAMQRLGEDLLGALGAVHAAGIVHRDVKPSNVLVTAAGRFKLADFGIAHLPGYEETIGGLGRDAAVGTVRYMSPEQARGEAVDARGDLYAAAVTLYEAWTGLAYLVPGDGDSLVDLQLRAAKGEGSLDACGGSSRLRAFFETALAVDPDERFASAQRMQVAFLDALRDAESKPRPGRSDAPRVPGR